ncbi:glutathione S-transferase family protein [Marinobacterium sedimentorum]|uniref:glutathione S-transferase family protein n=1 Tax=Marinobacterium sedimentorum TaxID=2927804 RepID=UPI0020C71FB5|nr:glutathione S-transferase family protein [Marinobacterium sedimentorum]MCP8690271.1 glutathione S-transferase family protein [Marinobacterium sedimentorum]
MLKLHGVALSNYYNIVKQTMLEKGIDFEEVSAPPSQDASFLAISPMGKIPCLETPEGFLSESLAIIEYLEETHPTPSLLPGDAYGRAKTREIIKYAELYLDGPARRLLGHVIFGAPLSQQAHDEVRPALEKGLTALKRIARFDPWAAGSEFSLADIALLHILGLVLAITKPVYDWDILAQEPELADWMQRAAAREHSQTVMAAQEKVREAMQAKKS